MKNILPSGKTRLAKLFRMGDAFSILDIWRVLQVAMVRRVGSLRNTLDPNYQFLKFLVTSLNRNAAMFSFEETQRALDRGDGKRYTVRRRFYPKKASGIHSGWERNYCGSVGAGNTAPYVEDSVEVGYSHVSAPITFDQCQLRDIPENKDQWINDRLIEHMRTYENDLAVKVAKRLVTGGFIGKHANGATSVDIPLFLANGKSINPTGEVLIGELMLQAQQSELPILIGGTLVSNYPTVSQFTSAHQLGWNASLLEQRRAVYRDVAISRQLGDDDAVIMAIPGALQLFTRLRHRGDFADPSDPYIQRSTIVSPFTGMTYDLIWRKACSDSGDIMWSAQFAIDWDLIGIPKCWTDDPCLMDITDVYQGKIVCSDMGVCDIPKFDGCIDPDALDLTPDPLLGCVGSIECATDCQARVAVSSGDYAKFAITAVNMGTSKVYGVNINGMDHAFTGFADDGYQMNSAGNIAAVAAQLQTALGTNGTVAKALYTTSGTLSDFIVFAKTAVLEIRFLVAGGADVEFTRDTTSAVKVQSLSTPSTGATVSTLAYAFTLGTTPSFSGAPGTAITGVNLVTGTVDLFFIETGSTAVVEGAVMTHTVTDSVSCTSNVTDTINFPA